MVRAFRFGGKSKKRKTVNDFMIEFRTKEDRDKILELHYATNLVIGNQQFILFKDIPQLLLDLRKRYTDVTTVLKKKGIFFRWEFP